MLTLGTLSATLKEAMRLWSTQKADGVPLTDRLHGLEHTLRASWPFTREWHYVCPTCSDTGLVLHHCSKDARCDGASARLDSPTAAPGRYRRLCAQYPDSDYEHDYSMPCWCPLGSRFKPKTPNGADFSDAGKSKPKTREWSRAGR